MPLNSQCVNANARNAATCGPQVDERLVTRQQAVDRRPELLVLDSMFYRPDDGFRGGVRGVFAHQGAEEERLRWEEVGPCRGSVGDLAPPCRLSKPRPRPPQEEEEISALLGRGACLERTIAARWWTTGRVTRAPRCDEAGVGDS